MFIKSNPLLIIISLWLGNISQKKTARWLLLSLVLSASYCSFESNKNRKFNCGMAITVRPRNTLQFKVFFQSNICLWAIFCWLNFWNFYAIFTVVANIAIIPILYEGVLNVCKKSTGERPCQNAILIKLQSSFIKMTLYWNGCSPVNFLHILRTLFPRNTTESLICKEMI